MLRDNHLPVPPTVGHFGLVGGDDHRLLCSSDELAPAEQQCGGRHYHSREPSDRSRVAAAASSAAWSGRIVVGNRLMPEVIEMLCVMHGGIDRLSRNFLLKGLGFEPMTNAKRHPFPNKASFLWKARDLQ